MFISNGFFANLSPGFDKLMMIVYLVVVLLNVIWIPIQFIYRYVVLCRQEDE